ncbi:MAG: efflux RND transporter periplasmic adaptor subunit [Isosphaeraceae bacterium]
MASRSGKTVLREIAAVYHSGAIRELTDGQLLERFLTGQEEAAGAAFSTLVDRHGRMVLSICRGILPSSHDAQDAFQATFLVLVMKARDLWVRDSLGPWLHQVALRTAQAQRVAAARRRRIEQALAAQRPVQSHPVPLDEPAFRLHAEIARLPERYRVPIILCDLEGSTVEQAARHLAVPVGTIKSRLARGRSRLRDRLQGREESIRDGSTPVSLPPALLVVTLRDATRAATEGLSAVPPTIRPLVLGGIRTMSLSLWWKSTATALAFFATLSSASLMATTQETGRPDVKPASKPKPAEPVSRSAENVAQRGPFRWIITERGSIEAAQSTDVVNPLPGQTRILSILPEGTWVKKDQVVAELDAGEIRVRLAMQRRGLRTAEGHQAKAEHALQAAQRDLKSYQAGTIEIETEATKAEIQEAEATAQAADQRMKRTRDALKQLQDLTAGKPTPESIARSLELENQVQDAQLTRLRALATIVRLKRALQVRDESVYPANIERLRSEIEQASTVLATQRALVESERKQVATLERQVEAAILRAPTDGTIVYANPPSLAPPVVLMPPVIREGAVVRERQLLFNIPDLSHMVMNAKVHESIVDQLKVGQMGTVSIDAFPGQQVQGTVEAIAPLPDPTSMLGRGPKLYSTRVRLSDHDRRLRPGMTAEIALVLAEVPDAIMIPVDSVLRFDGNAFVGLREADGSYHLHQVTLGPSDGKTATVKSGLKPGDQVHANPIQLLDPAQRQQFDRQGASGPGGIDPLLRHRIQNDRATPSAAQNKSARDPILRSLQGRLGQLSSESHARLASTDAAGRRTILLEAGLTENEIDMLERSRRESPPPSLPQVDPAAEPQ